MNDRLLVWILSGIGGMWLGKYLYLKFGKDDADVIRKWDTVVEPVLPFDNEYGKNKDFFKTFYLHPEISH